MGKGDRMEAEIEEHGLLHYLENVQGGNLKHLIDVTDGGKNLGFSLEYIDEENFWAYTYYRLQHEEGQEIIVYRTLFSRNYDKNYDVNEDKKMDVWKAPTSIMGAAKVTRYSSGQFKVLVETWREV